MQQSSGCWLVIHGVHWQGTRSVLLILETVIEVVEGGTIIGLLFHVAESEASLPVGALTGEDLNFVPLANELLNEAGGTLHETLNAGTLA